MTIQWMVVSFFLYFEIFVCVLLCLPFIKAKRWQYVFKSRLLNLVLSYGNYYFWAFIAILGVLLADAYREMQKYSLPQSEQVDLKNNPNAKDHVLMLLFRAQRNFYITGFSLFLLLILRRLATLISESATLSASNEALKKQAESASKAAEAMLAEKSDKKGEDSEEVTALADEIKDLKEKLAEARDAEAAAQNDLNAMKSQAKGVTDEYDRLMEEHAKLQRQLEASGDKKDD